MADSALGRRSSRAKTSSQSQSHMSSANSSSSGRSTRAAFTKTGSPQKSTGSASLSSESLDENNEDPNNPALRRRSMRGRDELERDTNGTAITITTNKTPKIELLDMVPPSGDDIGEDDEAVRCICGHDDYPGPPPYDPESKMGLKDASEFERIFGIEITDEIAGNFVQCEVCNSWQHSACVGFTTEEAGPDDVEYFCEMCRKDLHKIYAAGNGQKYSIFLPIHPASSRAASRAASATIKEGTRSRSPKPEIKPKSSRAAAAAAAAAAVTSKRRSTMNSRDAAYDEEEQIRRAIEASKEETIPEETEALVAATRRAVKRSREESEDRRLGSAKRQRTDSRSPSPMGDKPSTTSQDGSEDESGGRNGTSKKSRNTVRTREKTEIEERKEEQERKRAEAASKRKGRAERRRADDSDPSDEMPLSTRPGPATRTTESVQPPDPPPSSAPPPDTPPATQPPASSHKKKGTSQHKKGKGRNQYTKDRDNNDHDESPARSMPRDTGRNGEDSVTSHTKGSGHDGHTKGNTKSKTGMNSRITMADMKRRTNNILEYITRTQVELVNEPLSDSKGSSTRSTTEERSAAPSATSAAKVNGDNNHDPSHRQSKLEGQAIAAIGGSNGSLEQSKAFKEMSCLEMMDALTRDLVKWQHEYAS